MRIACGHGLGEGRKHGLGREDLGLSSEWEACQMSNWVSYIMSPGTPKVMVPKSPCRDLDPQIHKVRITNTKQLIGFSEEEMRCGS